MTSINMTLVYNSYSYLSVLEKSVPKVEWNSNSKIGPTRQEMVRCIDSFRIFKIIFICVLINQRILGT